MRLGMFMMPLHPAGRPMHEYLAEDTEKALLLDRLGYDELFIGEHYSAATEPYPSPMMFAASLLHRTERLVFGTGVINAPLHHPAMIAAEAAQFDHMSKGRFILGIGTGSTPTDIEMMGAPTDPAERGRMLAEAIEMIQASGRAIRPTSSPAAIGRPASATPSIRRCNSAGCRSPTRSRIRRSPFRRRRPTAAR